LCGIGKGEGCTDDAHISEAAGEVEEALRLSDVGVHENDPVDGERQYSAEREHGKSTNACATLASSPSDGTADRKDHRKTNPRLAFGYGAWHFHLRMGSGREDL